MMDYIFLQSQQQTMDPFTRALGRALLPYILVGVLMVILGLAQGFGWVFRKIPKEIRYVFYGILLFPFALGLLKGLFLLNVITIIVSLLFSGMFAGIFYKFETDRF